MQARKNHSGKEWFRELEHDLHGSAPDVDFAVVAEVQVAIPLELRGSCQALAEFPQTTIPEARAMAVARQPEIMTGRLSTQCLEILGVCLRKATAVALHPLA